VATTGFDLVTPSATLYAGQAEMIVCKTVEGEIAFLADHEAFIGALDPCVVRIVNPADAEGTEIAIAVHGGFVEVKDNHVIMLADIAERPDEIDGGVAEREVGEAQAKVDAAGSDGDRYAETELKWAQVRVEAAAL
jgi:F-type H+-transporting ATPase subunit epsilon